MASEWNEAKLTDLYEISSGLSKAAEYFGKGHPFLSFKDVFKNVFIPEHLSQLVESSDREQESCSIMRGDVFLTRTSETMNELGMSSVALKDYDKATFNGFTKRLRPKESNTLIPEYVGYYLRSPKFRKEMLAFSTMSTRASLNNEMISRLTISTPPEAEQKAIGRILKTLDDKIALNSKINKTLEGISQALFKSWFIDFDPVIDNALASSNPIPEELHIKAQRRAMLGKERKPLPSGIQKLFPSSFELHEEMGWIPKGWNVYPIEEILERLKVKRRYKKHDVSISGTVPVFEQGADILLGFHNCTPDVIADKTSPAFIFGDHTCVSRLSTEPFSISENVIPLRAKSYDGYWTFHAFKDKQSFEEYRRHWMELIIKPITTPDIEITFEFGKFVRGLYERREKLERQSITLAMLRDSLLPKLLSGQICIPDAEFQLSEVI